MARYLAKNNELKNQATAMQNIGKTLASFENRLNSISASIDTRDNNMASLRNQINATKNYIPAISIKITCAGLSIDNIADTYIKAEMSNYYNIENVKIWDEINQFNRSFGHINGELGYFEEKEGDQDKTEVKWGEYLFNLFGEIGTLGALVNVPLGIFNGSKDSAKGLLELIGTGAKVGKNISEGKLIDLFGTSSIDAIGFRENLAQKLDDYVWNSPHNSANSSSVVKQTNNVAAAVKWGGVALTGIFNFTENVEEYNSDFSNLRLYAETLEETVFDVGLGVLVGAGVAAIAGATAPVWAVGVVSTGVIMGMNWACEKLTDGQDLSEIVSDGYLNLVGDLGNSVIRSSAAVIDNTISIGNEVGKAVSAFSKSIATSWKNLNQWV